MLDRRLSKDYERKVQASETFIEVAIIRLILKRLVRCECEPYQTGSNAAPRRGAFLSLLVSLLSRRLFYLGFRFAPSSLGFSSLGCGSLGCGLSFHLGSLGVSGSNIFNLQYIGSDRVPEARAPTGEKTEG